MVPAETLTVLSDPTVETKAKGESLIHEVVSSPKITIDRADGPNPAVVETNVQHSIDTAAGIFKTSFGIELNPAGEYVANPAISADPEMRDRMVKILNNLYNPRSGLELNFEQRRGGAMVVEALGHVLGGLSNVEAGHDLPRISDRPEITYLMNRVDRLFSSKAELANFFVDSQNFISTTVAKEMQLPEGSVKGGELDQQVLLRAGLMAIVLRAYYDLNIPYDSTIGRETSAAVQGRSRADAIRLRDGLEADDRDIRLVNYVDGHQVRRFGLMIYNERTNPATSVGFFGLEYGTNGLQTTDLNTQTRNDIIGRRMQRSEYKSFTIEDNTKLGTWRIYPASEVKQPAKTPQKPQPNADDRRLSLGERVSTFRLNPAEKRQVRANLAQMKAERRVQAQQRQQQQLIQQLMGGVGSTGQAPVNP